MRKWQAYDYVIVNADLDRSLAAVRAILTAERLRRERTKGLGAFVDGLLAQAREVNPDPGAAGKRSAG